MHVAVIALAGVSLGGCNSGNDKGLPALRVTAFNFSPTLSGVRINAPLELTFTAPVDPNSVNSDSIRVFTTTTTTEQQDPGAPAIGEFVVSGNIVRFLPRIPQRADLSDSGILIGFRYAVQVPAAPDVVAPVTTTEGDPMVVPFSEEFTTLNQTILPAPADITAEPNLPTLHQFFIDEGIELGAGSEPCPRGDLPLADRDSPQVIFTDPSEGESGFGRITGIQPGLGTAFVRLDPITLLFSEPIGPWRVRSDDITIKNLNLDGETFDLFLFFQQDRGQSRLQITVFDADSAFDQASVPQGRYELALTNFSDLAGNPLVNSNSCVADGTFQLSFSTVSSPTLPTDFKITFGDDDGEGHVDVGGLPTGANNANLFKDHVPPFLGGIATDTVAIPSPSSQTSSANWGNIGMWTGQEVVWDNGYDPTDIIDMDRPIPNSLRLRGGSVGAGTAILAPIAGRASGPSDPGQGSTAGSIPVDPGVDPDDAGKVDFIVQAAGTFRLFTGDATTGPILYHYRRFVLESAGAGTERPILTYATGSMFPMMIFAEDVIGIRDAIINVSGQDGEFGFDGLNDGSGSSLTRNPGGRGGIAGPGGGAGGTGGVFTLGADITLLNGVNGEVPVNALGALDQLSQAMSGFVGMATGSGGWFDVDVANTKPQYSGGGGAGAGSDGAPGVDAGSDPLLPSGQGLGGKSWGTGVDFTDLEFIAAGGAGGGGGGGDDDGAGDGGGDPNGQSDVFDDGGGGGGGGGGFIGLYCAGNITLGDIDTAGLDPADPVPADRYSWATIKATGGRGGSTYEEIAGNPPVPGNDAANPNFMTPIGVGRGGGGGGGGGICIIAGGTMTLGAVELYPFGKAGGNHLNIEGGGRVDTDRAGDGGGGLFVLADFDGFTVSELPLQVGGGNIGFLVVPNSARDIDQDGSADITDPDDIADLDGMRGAIPLAPETFGIWGDDPRERMFGRSQFATEFFDTISDRTTFDNARILSNAPRYPYDPDPIGSPDPMQRTIRVFVDATSASGGIPDLSTENPITGNLSSPVGFTEEIGLHFDRLTGAELSFPQYESRVIIGTGSNLQFHRFIRVRVVFDLATIGTPDQLLTSFAPPGAPDEPIADDPLTPEPENTLGNTDTAAQGVPAIAEIRVTFTVGG